MVSKSESSFRDVQPEGQPPAEAQHKLFKAHRKKGLYEWTLGRSAAALESFRAAFAIADRLASADPENAKWQHELSDIRSKIGDIRTAQGEREGAFADYFEALGIAQRLAAAEPDNAETQLHLSDIAGKLGRALQSSGDLSGARAFYMNGLTVLDRLADDPNGLAQVRYDSRFGKKKFNLRQALRELEALETGHAGSDELLTGQGEIASPSSFRDVSGDFSWHFTEEKSPQRQIVEQVPAGDAAGAQLDPALGEAERLALLDRAAKPGASEVDTIGALIERTRARAVELLGGEAVLGRPIRNDEELVEALMAGFPAQVVRSLQEAGLPHWALERVIAPRRTLMRRKAAEQRLIRAESDAAWRLAHTLALASDVLNGPKAAIAWLTREKGAFADHSPIDLLETSAGTALVEQMLRRLDWGDVA